MGPCGPSWAQRLSGPAAFIEREREIGWACHTIWVECVERIGNKFLNLW
jgi:hypothetical protein